MTAVLALACVTSLGQARAVHHDAEGGFRNLEPTPPAGPTVTLPFFLRRALDGIVGRAGAAQHLPADRSWAEPPAGTPSATWVGHATVLVQADGATWLTDPIWSARASPLAFAGPRRLVAPGVAFDALPPIDFVVVSHAHYDHLDLPTLERLATGRTQFLVPLGLGPLLEARGIRPVHELDWWESIRMGDVVVHCVPARHWSQRGLFDRNQTLWAGWAVLGPTRRFYYAGDTGYTRAFREIGERLGPFDLAALPIGAYQPAAMMQAVHLDPDEAVRAGDEVQARRLLGVHWGTFVLTDEPLDEPPARFRAAAAAAGRATDDVWLLPVGVRRGW